MKEKFRTQGPYSLSGSNQNLRLKLGHIWKQKLNPKDLAKAPLVNMSPRETQAGHQA